MGCVTNREQEEPQRKVASNTKINAAGDQNKVPAHPPSNANVQSGLMPIINHENGTEDNTKTMRSSKPLEQGMMSKRQLLKKYSIKMKDSSMRTPTINSYQYETMLAHNPTMVDKGQREKEADWIQSPLHAKLNLNKV